MAITTLTEVKAILQIPDTTKDVAIEALIPAAQEYICDYCNQDFVNDAGEAFPYPVKLAAAKFISINLKGFSEAFIRGESATDRSVSLVDTVSSDLLKTQVDPLLSRYRKVSW